MMNEPKLTALDVLISQLRINRRKMEECRNDMELCQNEMRRLSDEREDLAGHALNLEGILQDYIYNEIDIVFERLAR